MGRKGNQLDRYNIISAAVSINTWQKNFQKNFLENMKTT